MRILLLVLRLKVSELFTVKVSRLTAATVGSSVIVVGASVTTVCGMTATELDEFDVLSDDFRPDLLFSFTFKRISRIPHSESIINRIIPVLSFPSDLGG